jgi:hypothetical protein
MKSIELPGEVQAVVEDVVQNNALTFYIADEPKTRHETLKTYSLFLSDKTDTVCDDGTFVYPNNDYYVFDRGKDYSGMFAEGVEGLRQAYGHTYRAQPYDKQELPDSKNDSIRLFPATKKSLFSRNSGIYVFRHTVGLVPQPVLTETADGIERAYSSEYELTSPILEYSVRGEDEARVLSSYYRANSVGSQIVWMALTKQYALDGMQEYAPTTPSWDYTSI